MRGETRRSLAVTERASGEQLRLVYPGPDLGPEESARVLRILDERLEDHDLLVLSGSLAPGLGADFYARASASVRCRTVVDTHGPPLAAVLEAGVFLVKPNAQELGELVGERRQDLDGVRAAARRLCEERRVRVVVVSLAERGAVLATRDGTEHVPAPEVEPVSAVGAGDSMVAGIVVGIAQGLELRVAVRLGVAAGAAAVETPGSDLARADEIRRLWRRA